MFFLLAAMLGIVAANAQITQGRIGTGSITIAGSTTTDVYGLDFDNDGTNLEFRISDFSGSPNLTNGYLSYNWTDGGNNIVNETGVWDYMAILASGVTVGSTSEFEGAGDGMFNVSNLTAGAHYMGFRISLSDGVHYGWAQFTVAENGSDYDLTWNKCYYNATVGASIETGDEGGSASCDVAAGDLPYSQGFETLDCWEEEVIAGSKHWEVTTYHYTAIQGTGYAIFGGAYSSEARLISPTFSVAGVPNLTLKFAHAQDAWGNDQDSLKVEYRLSPTDAWQTLATYRNSIASFEFASIPLPETSATLQIAFHAYSNYGYRVAIDSLTLTSVSCPVPVISNITVTDNSATVTWSGSASQYGITLDDGDEEIVTGTSKTFSGLSANTSHSISLRAVCGGEGSEVVDQTFRTACGTETFPYFEGFESYTAGTSSFPDCWTKAAGTSYVQENGSYTTYASQGTKALVISADATVVSPVINVAGSDVYVNFDLKRSYSSAGTLAVGIAASPALVAAAVYFDTIEPENTDYANYEYIFHNTLSLSSGCLVFKQLNSTSSYAYFYLDSLTVSEPPACPKPSDLTLTAATETSLTVAWTENGSATQWLIKVNDGAYQPVDANPYTINNLASGSTFTVELRAFCDPDTSDAVYGTFNTECAIETIPFSEDFEGITSGLPNCWEQVASDETRAKWNFTNEGHTGNGLEFDDYYGDNSRLIMPVINCSALARGAQLSFSYRNPAISNGNKATLALYYRTSSTGEWVAIDDFNVTTATEEWTDAEVFLPNSASSSYYQLSLLATGANTYPRVYAYIDDIYVGEPPACVHPSAPTAVPADESAVVTWTENGTATKWLVKKEGDAEYQLVENTPTYTFEGLTANTDYTVEVRSFCDPDTSDATSGTFRTACATQTVPYTETFDAMTTSEAPECWTVALSYNSWGSTYYPFVSSSAANGGSGNGLYFYASSSNSNIIASPMLDRNANNCLVTFDAKLANYEEAQLITGIMTNPSDASTFVALDTVYGNVNATTWQSYEIDLSTYDEIASSDAKYVAFKFNGNSDYGYLDNLSISVPLPCKKPTDLVATSTESSLEITWTENGSATQWLVKFNDGDYQLTSDNPYTVTGLEPSSAYTVEVRAYCGEGDTSYAIVGTFNTECAIEAVPYTEDFEGITEGLPNCWEQVASNETRSKWDFTESGYEGNAVFFEDYWGENSRLIISAVDCSTLTSDGVIRFSYKRTTNSYDAMATADLYYRTSSTGEWTAIEGWTLSETMDEWDDVELTLPGSANAPYYQVSILATGANTYSPKPSLYIDDLYIGDGSTTPETCDVPTGLAANNVTANSAAISWTGSAAQYEVELNGQTNTVSTNSYNAQGLTAATNYAVRVRALCDGGLTSDWTATVNFTTLDNGGEQPGECNTPTGLAVSNITANSASISWNEVTVAEGFDGEWNLAMGAEDSVHTMITPDATMHTLLQYLNMDFEDIDENVSVAGTLVPVTIEPASGDQMNISGSFDMAMYGVDDPVTFHFNTTGTVTSTGMTIAPATISETVRIMNAMNIDYTGTVTFAQPTALPVDGTLTIGIASMNISGYGDTTVYMMTGSVSISMVGTDLTASGTKETTDEYPTYELVVTEVATGVETPIANATTPYALQGLTASTDYTVKVRTHCDENSTSDWSAAVPFTTLSNGEQPVECDVPTNIVIDQESVNTPYAALITWTGTAGQYEVEITGGEQPVTATVQTNSYTFTGVAATTYTVRVRALCENDETSDWSAASTFSTPAEQGIDDVNASYSVNLYPNPANEKVTVSVAGLNGKAQVSVIDMSGRTVLTSTMEGDSAQLNVSKLAQGTYFVRINGENISTVRKLVVR